MKLMKTSIRGFGLLEILIALLVVSVGVVSIISINTLLTNKLIETENRITALNLAQERLEILKAQTGSTLQTFDTLASGSDNVSLLVSGASDQTTFYRSWSVASAGVALIAANAKEIEVAVKWWDLAGNEQVVAVRGMLSRGGEHSSNNIKGMLP